MAEQAQDMLRCGSQQSMSIHTRKITDSCRDKDCIEDLRVYLTTGSQAQLDAAPNARIRCAELITTRVDVEKAAFDGHHYCVNVTFFYRILADAMVGGRRPTTLYGLATFSKRAVLCGEDSRAHIYRSDRRTGTDGADLPVAVVEVLDPMVLDSKVKKVCDCGCDAHCQIPEDICGYFDEELVLSGEQHRLFVTLGQFSIIRLERDVQIVVPVVSYSVPSKQCCDTPGCAEDPCEMFSRIPFPEEQFSPKDCDEQGCQCGYRTT